MKSLWPDHEKWLAEYQTNLRKRRGKNTVKMYVAEIRHFLRWLETRHIQLPSLKQVDMISYRDEMIKKGMKPATINKCVSIFHSFHKWAIENQLLTVTMQEKLRLIVARKERPRWLSKDQVAQLLDVASSEKKSFQKSRNEALLHTMLYAGLRTEEVSLLEYKSMDYGDLIICEQGGTMKRRVPIQPSFQIKLLEWMKHRSQSSKEVHQKSPFLFVTERSGHMQPRAIQFVIEGFSAKAGFPITCQILRHTFCRRLVEQNVKIELIKKWAGHKRIQSVLEYVDHYGGGRIE